MHQAIAGRAFGASWPGARPARVVHDRIAGGVYAAVSGGTSVAGHAAGLLLGRRRPGEERRELSTTPRGAAVLAAVNGLIGDALEEESSDLQEPMALRMGGDMIDPRAAALAAAYPGATPHLVFFAHGLMESEHAWSLGADRREGETYASGLERELGATALMVRYNTGRHISDNGRSLAELIEATVDAWPVEVERIDVVGHSMGGLVARSACHQAVAAGQAWPLLLAHTVTLGTPHMGAPLAQGVHVLSAALHAIPEARSLAAFLRRRSAGIRDLRHGSLVDEDWRGRNPHAMRAAALAEVPLHDGARHWFVTATVTRSPAHPVGRLLGDALVLEGSGSGRAKDRRVPFEADAGFHVGGAHHLALLNHPAVHDRLLDWLSDP